MTYRRKSYILRGKSYPKSYILRGKSYDTELVLQWRKYQSQRQIQGMAQGARVFFAITCFFLISLKELQIVLLEVELIISNAPLTYVYPNTIETCLKPNHNINCS